MKNFKKLMISIFALALIMSTVFVVKTQAATKKVGLSKYDLVVAKGKNATVKIQNTTKKAEWTVTSGSECISIQKKGNTVVVTGKKYGTARLQAVVSGKNMSVR